jgi:hypothetical protein
MLPGSAQARRLSAIGAKGTRQAQKEVAEVAGNEKVNVSVLLSGQPQRSPQRNWGAAPALVSPARLMQPFRG